MLKKQLLNNALMSGMACIMLFQGSLWPDHPVACADKYSQIAFTADSACTGKTQW